MYQSIYKYAVDHQLTSEKYKKAKKIAARVMLDHNGDYQRIDFISKEKQTKVLCPDIKGGNNTASPICDKLQHIFGSFDKNQKIEFENPKRHESWINIMADASRSVPELSPVNTFLEKVEQDYKFHEMILVEFSKGATKGGDYISFAIENTNLESDSSWETWFTRYMEARQPVKANTDMRYSVLTGELIEPLTSSKFPMNTAKLAGTGAPLFSNDHRKDSDISCAFKSFGITDSSACPMSEEETGAVKAGLEALMDNEDHVDKRFEIMYWYEKNQDEDLIGRSLRRRAASNSKDQLEELRSHEYTVVLNEVFGEKTENSKFLKDNGIYHIIQYDFPDKGRMRLIQERTGTYESIYRNLHQWYEDSSLEYSTHIDKVGTIRRVYTLDNIYIILFGLLRHPLRHPDASDKVKELNNEFGANRNKLLFSVYENRQIPKQILERAVNETTNDVINGRQIRRILLQIIKTYLIREGDIEMGITLNKDSQNTAYNCGRWFAAMDQLQYDALGGVNAGIAKKFYKAAKKSPAKIISMVNDNKSNYLGKLEKNEFGKGKKIQYERLFADLAALIGTEFPEKFSYKEQGSFDLGYAQQKQDFYKKKADDQDEIENK